MSSVHVHTQCSLYTCELLWVHNVSVCTYTYAYATSILENGTEQEYIVKAFGYWMTVDADYKAGSVQV